MGMGLKGDGRHQELLAACQSRYIVRAPSAQRNLDQKVAKV